MLLCFLECVTFPISLKSLQYASNLDQQEITMLPFKYVRSITRTFMRKHHILMGKSALYFQTFWKICFFNWVAKFSVFSRFSICNLIHLFNFLIKVWLFSIWSIYFCSCLKFVYLPTSSYCAPASRGRNCSNPVHNTYHVKHNIKHKMKHSIT